MTLRALALVIAMIVLVAPLGAQPPPPPIIDMHKKRTEPPAPIVDVPAKSNAR